MDLGQPYQLGDVFQLPPPSKREATYANLRGEEPTKTVSTSVTPVKRVVSSAPNQPQQRIGSGGDIDSLISDYQRQRSELDDKYDKLLEVPDYSKVSQYAKDRSARGANALMLALAAQQGGEDTKPIGAMYLKQASEARNPMKVASGYIDENGVYTEDPDARREIEAKRLENRVKGLDTNISNLTTKKEQMENQRAMRAMAQGTANGMNDLRRTMLELSIAEKTGKLAEQGLGPDGKPLQGGTAKNPYPDAPNPKATEDERKSTYLVNRIVTNAGLVKKGSEGPDAKEYVASKLPLVGDEAAKFVRSGPRQSTYQSQLDTIDSLLTLATGAAYTKDQLKNAFESYMPTYQDKPEAIVDKEARLRGAVQAAKVRAGRSWTMEAENALRAALPPAAFSDGPAIPPTAQKSGTPGVKNFPVGTVRDLPGGGKAKKVGPGENDWERVAQ